jgi:hypothetical protein
MRKSGLKGRFVIYGILAVLAVAVFLYQKQSNAPYIPPQDPKGIVTQFAPVDYPYPLREAVTKQYYLLALRYLLDVGQPVALFGKRESLAVQRLKSDQGTDPNTIKLVYKDKTLHEIVPAKNGYFDVMTDIQEAYKGVRKLIDLPSAESLSAASSGSKRSTPGYNPVSIISELNSIDERLRSSFNMEDLLQLARFSAFMAYHLESTYSQPAWFHGTAIAASDMAYQIWGKPECLETLAFALAVAGRRSDAETVLDSIENSAGQETAWGKYARAMITYDDEILAEDSSFPGRFIRAELLSHDYKDALAVEKYKDLLQDDPFFWLAYEGISSGGTISDRHRSTVVSFLAILGNADVWRQFNLKESPNMSELESLFNSFAEIEIKINNASGIDNTALISPALSYHIFSSILESSVAGRLRFLGWSFGSPDDTREFLNQTQAFLNQSEIGDLIRVIGTEALGQPLQREELILKSDSLLTTSSRLSLAYKILNPMSNDNALEFLLRRRNRLDDTSRDRYLISSQTWSSRRFWGKSIQEAKRALQLSPYNHDIYNNLKSTEYTEPWDKRGLEKIPHSYAMHVDAGDYYFRSVVPRYSQAEPLYEKAISLYPYNYHPYKNVAAIYLHDGKLEKMKGILESYLKYDSTSLSAVSAQCRLADVYMEEGALKRAYALLKDASESWKGDALLGFAHVNERLGDMDTAEKYYIKAKERYRNSASEDLGYFQVRNERAGGRVLLKNVIRNLEDTYSRKPGNVGILGQIGGIYAVLGDLDRAQTYLEKELQAGGHDTFIELMLGVIAYEKGEDEKARTIFSQTNQSHSYKDDFKDILPVLQGRRNADEFMQSISHDYTGAYMYFILYYYYLMQKDEQKALECLKKVVRAPVPSSWTWNVAYLKLKRLKALTLDFWSTEKVTAYHDTFDSTI